MRPRLVVLAAAGTFLAYLGATCRPFFSFALARPSAFGAWTLIHVLDVGVLQPALVLLLLWGARGLGERLFGAALLSDLGEERPLFSCALGLGALSILVAVVAAVDWNRPVALAFWAGLAALALTAPPPPRPRAAELSAAEALAAVLAAVAVLSCWVQAAAPPTSWDALAYHLDVPKRWLALGRLGFDPSVYIAKNPLHVETLYLLAFGLSRDTLAQMLHLGFAVLCLLAVLAFARKRLSARAGLLAAAVFACQPLFSAFAGTGNTDFAVCFYALLAVWAFDEWAAQGGRRRLALAGALTGLACAAKIIGLWLALALTALLAVQLLRRRRAARAPVALGDLAVWTASGAAAGAPWYALNWAWLGDPVWPYFARFFGAGPLVQALFERLKASVTEGFSPTLGHLLALPYLLLFRGAAFWYGPQFLIAPLLLAAAWALARRRGLGLSRTIAAACALYALLWFFGYQGWRYAVPLLPWGCLAVGVALDDACSAGRLPRAAAAALLLTLAFFSFGDQPLSNQLFALSAANPSAPGQTWRQRYLSLSLDHYDLFSWCNANLPKDAQVMLYGEVRPYYLDRPSFLGDPLNDFRVGYAALQSPEELESRLRELGVTHVLARPEPSTYLGDQDYYRHADALMRAYLAGRAAPVAQRNGLALYALTPAGQSPPFVKARR